MAKSRYSKRGFRVNAERAKKIVRADSDDLHDSRDRLQSSYRAVALAKAGEVLADRCDELEKYLCEVSSALATALAQPKE